MRIKSLSILASFIVISLAVTSCLDSENNYEPSSDDLITAFSLDTIYGKTYTFTIDQQNGLIYNVDSVPYSADTIIDNILIRTLTTNGYVSAGTDNAAPYAQDTLFDYTDSVDFIKHNPLTIRVRSYDGLHVKPYRIEIRRHRVDPDTLVWGNDPSVADDAYIKAFTAGGITTAGESKAVLLTGEIFVFADDGTTVRAYKGSGRSTFPDVTLSGLPAEAGQRLKVSSVLNVTHPGKEALYGVTEDGRVFTSTDGATWTAAASDVPVITLITTFNETLAGIIQTDTGNLFATATVHAGGLTWKTGAPPPDNFPTGKFSATKAYTTPTGGKQALLIGPAAEGATWTSPWFSTDGLNWGEIPVPGKTKYALPAMTAPAILYYGKTVYAFGKTVDGFSTFYTSPNGIVWEKIEKKFMLPLDHTATSVFKERTGGYSTVVDDDNYLWMFWNSKDDAWRGKLGRLGFDIQ